MNKSWIERLLGRPYGIYSFLTLFLFLGIMGYNRIDRKLFPESNYPEIAVVIVQPGGSAKTIAASLVMGAAVWVAARVAEPWLHAGGIRSGAGLAAVIVFGMVVYMAAALGTRATSVQELKAAFKKESNG